MSVRRFSIEDTSNELFMSVSGVPGLNSLITVTLGGIVGNGLEAVAFIGAGDKVTVTVSGTTTDVSVTLSEGVIVFVVDGDCISAVVSVVGVEGRVGTTVGSGACVGAGFCVGIGTGVATGVGVRVGTGVGVTIGIGVGVETGSVPEGESPAKLPKD